MLEKQTNLLKITAIAFIVGLFVAEASLLFLVLNEKNYKTETAFLVIEDGGLLQDFYSLTKSAEYKTRVFTEAIFSDLFIDEVINTGKITQDEILPQTQDKKEVRKEWEKTVKITKNQELGIMTVAVLSDDKDFSLRASEGIAQVLVTKNFLFRGPSQDISFVVLSGPLAEKNPEVKEMVLATIGGFIVGILITLVALYYVENKKGDRPLLKKVGSV